MERSDQVASGSAENENEIGLTRRRALRDLGAAGLALTGVDALLAAAAEAAPRHGTLADIDHVVIFIQENRSFDHYFGTYSGVRGFGDKVGRQAFFQKTLAGKTLHPFRLRSECLPDLTHDWGPQHRSWNHGRMNRFVIAHEQTDPSENDEPGLETMGYYEGADVAVYHELANAFTICDGYHCSVIGPTDPNRLMSMSASIDPHGKAGGPLVYTRLTNRNGVFSWRTMPEQLEAKGISWKVYTSPAGGVLDNVLTYFKQYRQGSTLAARGLEPTFPGDFMTDLAAGSLPRVSWLLAGISDTEHPDYSSPMQGQATTLQVVQALLAHPKIWRRTALFLTWDENGGFFDHVAPPVAPPGTAGEYLTVPATNSQGIRGPIGLGFRVPMLVISPFSRGGLVCPDTFDHTSTLRFLETRFGARVPNLSHWRRSHTGDLTSAFNFAAAPSYGKPRLAGAATAAACTSFPPPAVIQGPFPKQQTGRRRRPSGIVG